MRSLDTMLRASIHEGALEVTDHDGQVYRYGAANTPPVAIQLKRRGTARRIARNPDLGAGEAYMNGELVVVVPHTIRDLIALFMRNAAATPQAPSVLQRLLLRAHGWVEQSNSRRQARRNVMHHYDLSRRFYELFLDKGRFYTMAYFRNPDAAPQTSLELAQKDKAALIAAKLQLKPGMRVLDIGCGWGSLAMYLHHHYDVDVLGISLAPDQVAFATQAAQAAGVGHRLRFRQMDYRDVDGQFDRIASVGMFEHVGRPNFRAYFAATRALLADGGVMLTHTIGRLSPPAGTSAFTRKHIFPGGYIPAMSEIVAAMEDNGWAITDLEVLRYHYAHTLQEWYRRTVDNRAEIVALYDDRLFRMWQFYLAGAEQSFRSGRMANFQIQSALRLDALPFTRDYIINEAERLFALNRQESGPAAPGTGVVGKRS